jgi:hypothetical protein
MKTRQTSLLAATELSELTLNLMMAFALKEKESARKEDGRRFIQFVEVAGIVMTCANSDVKQEGNCFIHVVIDCSKGKPVPAIAGEFVEMHMPVNSNAEVSEISSPYGKAVMLKTPGRTELFFPHLGYELTKTEKFHPGNRRLDITAVAGK